jgi:hypothetical protein
MLPPHLAKVGTQIAPLAQYRLAIPCKFSQATPDLSSAESSRQMVSGLYSITERGADCHYP